MLNYLAAVVPISLGALLASLPVVAMAAVLATLNTRAVLLRFVVGWLAGLVSVAVVGLLLVDEVTDATDSAAWVAWLRIVLGVLLFVLAARKFVAAARRGPGADDPKWMTAMTTISARRAFGLAYLLGSVNPKNVVIVLSAVSAAVYQTAIVGEQIVALLVFIVIASIGVAAPALAVLTLGDRATGALDGFVQWFARNSALVMGVVLMLLGILVIVTGVQGVLTQK